jgi:hypothetical protein
VKYQAIMPAQDPKTIEGELTIWSTKSSGPVQELGEYFPSLEEVRSNCVITDGSAKLTTERLDVLLVGAMITYRTRLDNFYLDVLHKMNGNFR